MAVHLVVAPARRLVGFGRDDLTRDDGADQRLVVGLAAPFRIFMRDGINADAPGLLQQQLADDQRPRRREPSLDRLRSRVILRLPRDGRAGDHDAVDADGLLLWSVMTGLIVQPAAGTDVLMS